MKKFISKSLSLLLCVTLVLSTMVSVFGGIFVSAAEADDIETLKASWTSMISKSAVSTNKWPRFYVNSTGTADTAYIAPATYVANGGSIDGITTSDLGALVATQDIEADSQFLFGGQNPSNPRGDTTTYIQDFADAYIYYKVNSVTTEGQFGLTSWAHSNFGSPTVSIAFRERASNSKISVTAEDVDKGWQRIQLDEFFNDRDFDYDWRTSYDSNQYLLRLGLTSENGLEANITFGSLVAYNNASLPEGSESWGIREWLDAAGELDLSGYYNTEQFEETVAALLEIYPVISADEAADITALKAAWGAMTETQLMQTGFRPVKNAATAHVRTTDEKYAFSTQTPTSTADAIAAGIDLTGITAADLGDTVATYDFEYDNYGMVVFSTNDVVGYHSSYKFYKIKLSDLITQKGFYNAWFNQLINGTYTRYGDRCEDYVFNGLSNILITSVNAKCNLEIGYMFADSYLDVGVSESGSTDDIVEAAKLLDATGYDNADAFTEIVAKAGLKGDATGDGKVNVLDVLRTKKRMADETVQIYMYGADMNDSGSLEADDLARIQAKILA